MRASSFFCLSSSNVNVSYAREVFVLVLCAACRRPRPAPGKGYPQRGGARCGWLARPRRRLQDQPRPHHAVQLYCSRINQAQYESILDLLA
jgi:hypothetical protein